MVLLEVRLIKNYKYQQIQLLLEFGVSANPAYGVTGSKMSLKL